MKKRDKKAEASKLLAHGNKLGEMFKHRQAEKARQREALAKKLGPPHETFELEDEGFTQTLDMWCIGGRNGEERACLILPRHKDGKWEWAERTIHGEKFVAQMVRTLGHEPERKEDADANPSDA